MLWCCKCSLDFAATGQSYYTEGGEHFCTNCYNSVFAKTCGLCRNSILGTDSNYRLFQGKNWHNKCFKCSDCQRSLVDDKSMFYENNKIYCHPCHEENFSPRCDGCGGILKAGIQYFVHEGKKLHAECYGRRDGQQPKGSATVKPSNQQAKGPMLSCYKCNLDFIRTGQSYYTKDNQFFCTNCYNSVFAKPCGGLCGKSILGTDFEYRLYQGKHWHNGCFKCSHCQRSLVDKSSFYKNNKIFCPNCHEENFSPRCDGCGGILKAGIKYFLHQGKKLHYQCYTCSVCHQPIGNNSFFQNGQDIVCVGCDNAIGTPQSRPCSGGNSTTSDSSTYATLSEPDYRGYISELSADDRLYSAVNDLVIDTFDIHGKVSHGADAKNLDYKRLVVKSICQLKNEQLLQAYSRFTANVNGEKLRDPESFKSLPDLPHGGEQIMTIEKAHAALKEKCNESLNECYLFHGTEGEIALAILATGFKKEKGNPKSVFGQATYFAESSSKADQYADWKHDRVTNGTSLYMILTKACLGRIHVCREKPQQLNKPPCTSGCDPKTNCQQHPLCHSVVGTHLQRDCKQPRNLRFREFVVYEDNACFPEFVVEYIRE